MLNSQHTLLYEVPILGHSLGYSKPIFRKYKVKRSSTDSYITTGCSNRGTIFISCFY
nr:MAG TPA: hypothetical protein [Crassvirales sp.]